MAQQKWWGWGDGSVAFSHADKPHLGPFLERHLGIDVEHVAAHAPRFEDLDIPEPQLQAELRGALEEAVRAAPAAATSGGCPTWS
jgi:alkyldihydroxyacetonephosphate synthase